MDKTEARKKTIINIVYWILVLGLIFLAVTRGLGYIMPFLLGFVVAMIVKPVIDWMERKLRGRRKLLSIITVLFFYLVIGTLLTTLGIVVINQIKGFFANFGRLYDEQILPAIQRVAGLIDFDWSAFDPEIAGILQTAYDSIIKALSSGVDTLVDSVVRWGSGTITSLPGFFVNMLFTIVATFFIASDYHNVTGFILRQLPEKTARVVVQFKNQLGSILGQYIRSYATILSITFVELLIGLSLIGVERLLLVAFAIAVFDILPVVGTGTVLAPWGIIELIQGDTWRGLALIALWLVITIVRNIIEPKIVGENVGLHPLVTLISMYVGTKLFGGIGLFGLPITMAILNELDRKGAIQLFKRPPSDDTQPPPAQKGLLDRIKTALKKDNKTNANDKEEGNSQ